MNYFLNRVSHLKKNESKKFKVKYDLKFTQFGFSDNIWLVSKQLHFENEHLQKKAKSFKSLEKCSKNDLTELTSLVLIHIRSV